MCMYMITKNGNLMITHYTKPFWCSVPADTSEEHVGTNTGQNRGHRDHYHIQAIVGS